MKRDRARVQVVDVAQAFFILVALIALAPILYKFVGMASGAADPFSALLLELSVPLLFISLIVSVGISARRRG